VTAGRHVSNRSARSMVHAATRGAETIDSERCAGALPAFVLPAGRPGAPRSLRSRRRAGRALGGGRSGVPCLDAARRDMASADGPVPCEEELDPAVWESAYFAELEQERRDQRTRARRSSKHVKRQDQAEWAARRSLNGGSHLGLAQIRSLLEYFQAIDKDGSGDISLMELADPLLTTGLADSIHECVEIFSSIDSDGSGEIDFHEFLQLITIKSSGRLARERERKRRQESGAACLQRQLSEKDAEAAKGKASGILAVLERLSSEKVAATSLTTAIGVERRKFLIHAVMPDLSDLRVRIDPSKFRAIERLLLSSSTERRQTLLPPRAGGFLFPNKSTYFVPAAKSMRRLPRRRTAPGELANQPAQEGNRPVSRGSQRSKRSRGSTPNSSVSRRAPTHSFFASYRSGESPGFASDIGELPPNQAVLPPPQDEPVAISKALPRVQKFPPGSRVRANMGLRARVSTGPQEAHQEVFLRLERRRMAAQLDIEEQALVHKPNSAVNGPATERARRQLCLRNFFHDFLPASADTAMESATVQRPLRFCESLPSIGRAIRAEDARQRAERVQGVFRTLGIEQSD